MTDSFLKRLLAGKQETSLREMRAAPEAGNIAGDSLEPPSIPPPKIHSLYAFVDLKDPFAPGEIAGEELPGPILSIMSARQMSHLYLFHTPHTRAIAAETRKAILERYPQCSVRLWEISAADPKDYSSLMGPMTRAIRHSIEPSSLDENYVCVSSGTAEMRAIWFLLTALGVLRAKLLQVGSPAHPLFGEAHVKEVRIDMGEWETLRNLVMPESYFGRTNRRPLEHRMAAFDVHLEASEEATAGSSQDLRNFTSASRESKETTPSPESENYLGPPPSSCSPVPGLDEALQELGIHVGSAMLRHAAEQSAIAAGSHLPVLLLGETGTGKERFAHLIHRLSSQNQKDLIPINCAAIPESIAEGYLFGHAKGSFSGATADKPGMFEQANGSTLFLDEIAELSLDMQAKLLRVIQDGVVQRIGAVVPRKLEVRIVAATNRDLAKEVSAGRFRQDLYFRLEVVAIKLPALRERRSEIPELALAILKQINQRRQKPRQLSKDALRRLEGHAWPGNVRELSNVLERSVLYAKSDIVDADDLLITPDNEVKDQFIDLPEPFPGFSIENYLAQLRKQLFLRALAACNGNQAEAALRLGISKQAVSKFMASHTDNAN